MLLYALEKARWDHKVEQRKLKNQPHNHRVLILLILKVVDYLHVKKYLLIRKLSMSFITSDLFFVGYIFICKIFFFYPKPRAIIKVIFVLAALALNLFDDGEAIRNTSLLSGIQDALLFSGADPLTRSQDTI